MQVAVAVGRWPAIGRAAGHRFQRAGYRDAVADEVGVTDLRPADVDRLQRTDLVLIADIRREQQRIGPSRIVLADQPRAQRAIGPLDTGHAVVARARFDAARGLREGRRTARIVGLPRQEIEIDQHHGLDLAEIAWRARLEGEIREAGLRIKPAMERAPDLVRRGAARRARPFEIERAQIRIAVGRLRACIGGMHAADIVVNTQLNLAVEAQRGIRARNQE